MADVPAIPCSANPGGLGGRELPKFWYWGKILLGHIIPSHIPVHIMM